ncbi:MAG: hypothetical protein KAS78_03075 [Candidatus Pacebacteria bacterium]|nr:hypothetical protein [Candidatus Paceibacterota bacterium]
MKMKSIIANNLVKELEKNPITLIKEERVIKISKLNDLSLGEKIVVCDAYVEDIENIKGVINKEFGFIIGDIIVIDHHAPVKRFARFVSSTNLAVEYVREHGIVDKSVSVIINHTDADSILSSLIIRGILPPEKMFEEAAIVADHTGGENQIADLLQALKHKRDIKLSVRNLQLLLNGEILEPEALALVKERYKERQEAKKIVDSKKFQKIGKITYVYLEKSINSAFWPSLIPDAQIILTSYKGDYNNLIVRTRLGMAAPKGLALNKIGIDEFDLGWGGRWNAGSNRRSGGTKLSSNEYIINLNIKVEKFLKYINNKKI